MATIVEKNSSSPAVILIFVVVIFMIGGAGLAFGYWNGTYYREKPVVIENNRTIENKTVMVRVQNPPSAREVVPETPGPEQQHAH